MSPSTHYDIIIIGTGSGGGTPAYKLAHQERRFSWRVIDEAWAQLRKHHVRQISPRPQTIPISNPAAAGIKAFR